MLIGQGSKLQSRGWGCETRLWIDNVMGTCDLDLCVCYSSLASSFVGNWFRIRKHQRAVMLLLLLLLFVLFQTITFLLTYFVWVFLFVFFSSSFLFVCLFVCLFV